MFFASGGALVVNDCETDRSCRPAMERFSCGIFLFTLGFVVRTALGSFSSSSPDHCDGAISHISNGLCDEDTNNEGLCKFRPSSEKE